MEIIIVYKKQFEDQINELIDILYAEKYFAFEEYAVEYVEKIYEFIYKNIAFPMSKNSPFLFQRFGRKYLGYKAKVKHTGTFSSIKTAANML